MTDNEATTVTIDDVLEEPRRRTYPSKERLKLNDVDEKPSKPSPPIKWTAKSVERSFEMLTKTAVLMGANDLWYVDGKEVNGYSQDMADLLNQIPARYLAAATRYSSALTVAVGLVMTFKPRYEAQTELWKAEKRQPVTDNTEMAA